MAKTQAAANGCSNRTPDNCSNGCYVDTPAQVCDGKGVSCDSIVDQDTCNQFSCSWNKDKQSCSNGAGDIPPSCSQFDTNSCPTAYGCDIIQPDPVCTGTSDPTTITQDQCGMVPQYAYQGTWETEDSNSCPADCTDTPEGPTGELSNTVTGAGDLDGIVFSKSADVTGATVGDTINYTLHYENNSATNSDLGVMIKDYLPENLQILNASAT